MWAEIALERVARNHGVSLQEVTEAIEQAMAELNGEREDRVTATEWVTYLTNILFCI